MIISPLMVVVKVRVEHLGDIQTELNCILNWCDDFGIDSSFEKYWVDKDSGDAFASFVVPDEQQKTLFSLKYA